MDVLKHIRFFFLGLFILIFVAVVLVTLEVSSQSPEEKQLLEVAKAFIYKNEEIDSIFGEVNSISSRSLEVNMEGFTHKPTPGKSKGSFYVKGKQTKGVVKINFKKGEHNSWIVESYELDYFRE